MKDTRIKIDHKWLKGQIDDRGLKHNYVAEHIGISKQMLSLVLAGKIALSTKRWVAMAKFLGIDWKDMNFTVPEVK